MRYFLKLATNQGWYEEVDEYTYKNANYALNDEGKAPRYEKGAILLDGDKFSANLELVPLRDLAILARALGSVAPVNVNGGFILEQPAIKFKKGNSVTLRTKDGQRWKCA